MIAADSLFDLDEFSHRQLFSAPFPVWNALSGLKSYMEAASYQTHIFTEFAGGTPLQQTYVIHENQLLHADTCTIEYGDTCKGKLLVEHNGSPLEGASVIMAGSIFIGDKITIGRGSLIEGGATIKAPTIIGDCTEVRQGAYIRGYCLFGDRCVVGHATEVKHSIFLNDAKAGHFAYLGDSILGNNANLGAGTKFANLKFTPGNVKILYQKKLIDTGMRKFGAILGDNAQTGCNSVTNPGTIIGRKGILMPNTTSPSGYHEDRKRIR